MSGTQQGHQIFHVTVPTFIPDWVPEGWFEDLRSTIFAGIQGSVNVQAFLSQGHNNTQSVTVKNLSFPVVGSVSIIPYTHYNIEYDIDVLSDPDFLSSNDIIAILAVVGVIAIVASFFVGGPIATLLVGVGIFVLIAAGLLAVVETVHEILGPGGTGGIWSFLTSPIGLLVIGTVVGGYFLWDVTGREQAKRGASYAVSGARRAAPHVKAAARKVRAGQWH